MTFTAEQARNITSKKDAATEIFLLRNVEPAIMAACKMGVTSAIVGTIQDGDQKIVAKKLKDLGYGSYIINTMGYNQLVVTWDISE